MPVQQPPSQTTAKSRQPRADFLTTGHDLLSAARRWAGKLREYNAAKRPQRYAVVKTASIKPLEGGADPSEPVEIATRDISETGVGFLTATEIPAGPYQIQLPQMGQGPTSKPRSRRIEVLRVESLGLYYDVSAKFVQSPVTATRDNAAEPLDEIDAGVTRLRQHQLAMHQLVRSIDRRLQTANSIPKEPK